MENHSTNNQNGEDMYFKVLHKDATRKDSPALVGLRKFTVNHLYANVWSRSKEECDFDNKITLRERRLITIALLAAQGFADQLKEHTRGAFFAGIQEGDLVEVMIHVAHYSGWPAGTHGQKIIQQTYQEYLQETDKA